jgi:hypothetical protein
LRSATSRVDTKEVANGGFETVYKFVAGDAVHPSEIRVGAYPPAKEGKAYNMSVKITTWGKAVDGASIETWTPFNITLATSDFAGLGVFCLADYLKLVQMVFSVIVPGHTAGVVSLAAATPLQFGATDILNVTP